MDADGNRSSVSSRSSSRKRRRGSGDDAGSSSSSRKRRRGNGDDARTWSDIPWDIMCNVLRRLTIRDFVCCGAVCASWRSAMLQRQCRPRREPPWAIPFSGRVPKRRLRRLPSMPWEMIRSSEYIGSSNGWLGLQCRESVHILHALSGDVLQLPDLTAIPGVEVVRKGRGRALVFPYCGSLLRWRFALKPKGSPFIHSIFIVEGGDRDQLIVLAVCYDMWRLLFTRSGDVSWSLVEMPSPVGNDGRNLVMGIAGHRGSVYAVDMFGCVAAWDYCCSSGGEADAGALALGPRFTRIVTLSAPPSWNRLNVQRYLVEEANGDLLQVEMEVALGAKLGSSEFVRANVFRLEQSGGGESEGRAGYWRLLRHLGHGGTAIVVGRGFSAAFTCSDFPWLRRNCIYSTGGVYNLMTRKMRRLPQRWLHGNWLAPSLRSPGMGPLQA